ncbi:MAG: hypothetical protein KIT33_13250 [Candidatus Kapabacteria bacterium]|nr:hypothetical protein [Ignavibacteriota bacterium]MCW5885930.1 hypothetical protein [Candidatus Kapabacteria bacterium]
MTKYIIILLLSVTSLLTQNFEPSQKLFKWGLTGDSVYISSDLEYFRQSKPILGWHWAMGKKMTESLGFNQSHIGDVNSFNSVDSVAGNINVIKNSTGVYSNGNHLRVMNTIAMQWEPTLHINDAKEPLCSSLYLSNKYYDEYRKVLCSNNLFLY